MEGKERTTSVDRRRKYGDLSMVYNRYFVFKRRSKSPQLSEVISISSSVELISCNSKDSDPTIRKASKISERQEECISIEYEFDIERVRKMVSNSMQNCISISGLNKHTNISHEEEFPIDIKVNLPLNNDESAETIEKIKEQLKPTEKFDLRTFIMEKYDHECGRKKIFKIEKLKKSEIEDR